jgi:uncharacterized membrane protein
MQYKTQSKSNNKYFYQLLLVFLFAFLILSNVSYASGAAAPYDEQLGMTLVDNYTALGYNVTAVAQTSGTSGTGPGYLLNGYSNTGYWYQVGLSWNWATFFGYSPNQFLLSYEVFAPNGTSIYPSNGGTGLLNLSGPVNEGNIVLLNLYLENNTVIFLVKDWNTGAEGVTTFPAYGATEFVGNPYSANTNGFFTGLMTEWYGNDSSFPIQQKVTYSPYGTITSPAWLWADEFYCVQPCYQKQVISYNSSSSPLYPTSSHYFTLTPGSTEEYTYGAVFITGTTPPAPFYLLSSNINNLEADEGSTLNYLVNVSVAGGTPPYKYKINVDGIPNLVQPVVSNQTSVTMDLNLTTACMKSHYNNSLICSITPGSYYYNVTATDNEGQTVTSPRALIQLNNPPQITLNIPKTTIDAGQVLDAAYNVTGGSAPFNVSYFIDGKGIGKSLVILEPGNYSLYAEVTDAFGKTATSPQVNIVVNRQPSIYVNYSSTTTDVNTPLNLYANASGGTPPYSYAWYVNKQLVGRGRIYTFSENQAGTYIIYASLTDVADYVVNSSRTTLTVNARPVISTFRVIPASSSSFDVNNSASGAVNIAGGTPPYSYAWYVNGVLQPNSNSSSYIFESLKTGANNVSVTAIDAYGNVVRDSFIVETSHNYSTLDGIVVLVVVIGLIVYLLYRKRAKPIKEKKLVSKVSSKYLNVLKTRYAKGEITKKQYDKLRKDLE